MAELIERRIASVNEELDKFPEPPMEPSHEVMILIE
jgi:hypothetical protein